MRHEAFPLFWPDGRPRTERPERARFDTSFDIARHNLSYELNKIGATNEVISTNVPLRKDGYPYASRRDPNDSGVAVYFTYKGQPTCFACDRWDRVKDNIQAIRKTIESLRGIARWGTGDMIQAAFKGYQALPAPASRDCWAVLGIRPNSDKKTAHAAYKNKAKTCHPNAGGTNKAFIELKTAYVEAIGE